MAGGYSATGNALVHGMAHMPNYLVSPDNPDGKRTEEIPLEIRAEILVRMASYAAAPRPAARPVMENNLEIAQLLTEPLHLAAANTHNRAEMDSAPLTVPRQQHKTSPRQDL